MRYPRRASLCKVTTVSRLTIRSEKRHSAHNKAAVQRGQPAMLHSFHLHQEVLARWIDGLLYLGRIVKVDERGKRCYIKFEDDSEHWTWFKDIQKGRCRGEISCVLCQGGKSVKPNEIVLCDHCGLGYHQQCHQPNIGRNVLKADVKWFCRQCIFAATAKVGGAFKTGLNAQAMLAMKLSLPYKLSTLTWDSHHKTNEEECYCYCSGPGEWYLKMLQCCRCGQWFHEACLQCLDKPLIYGDRFYVFVCSACNCGPEYIKRLEIPWIDAIHLCLFNLTIMHNHKYYDFDTDIVPWLDYNWNKLQLGQLQALPEMQRSERILQILNSNKVRFQSGREIKKSMNLWGLRVRLPPTGPAIELPTNGQITARVVNNIQLKWPKRKSVDRSADRHNKRSASLGSYKRHNSCELKNVGKRARYISAIDLTSNGDEAVVNNSQDYTGYKGEARFYDVSSRRIENNDRKTRKSGVKPPKVKTLDSKIPRPDSYIGTNHPFRTTLESNMAIEHKKRKEELLKALTRKDGDHEAETTGFTESKTLWTHEIGQVRRHRGRKSKAECLMAAATNGNNGVNSMVQGHVTADANGQINGLVAAKQIHSSARNYFRPSVTNRAGLEVLARRCVHSGATQYLVQFNYGASG